MKEDPIEAEKRLKGCLTSLNDLIRNVRNFIVGLDPSQSHSKDFKTAMEALVASMSVSPTNQLFLEVDPEASKALKPHATAHLLQICREAISNSLRHSHASSTRIRLEKADEQIHLEISDDGVGFDPDTVVMSGFGLRNMSFRAEELGSQLDISSKLNEGTRITLDLACAPQNGGRNGNGDGHPHQTHTTAVGG